MQHLLNIPSDVLSFELFPFFQIQDIGSCNASLPRIFVTLPSCCGLNWICCQSHDIIMNIFVFCHTLCLGCLDIAVCQKFRPMLYEIYSTLCLAHSPRGVTIIQMHWFLNRSISLENVYLPYNMSAIEISEMFESIHRLNPANGKYRMKSINTRYNTLQHEDISLISQHYTSVLSLTLKYCSISDADINLLIKGCQELTSLDLTGCDVITHKTVVVLLQSCSKLTALNLSECNITDLFILSLTLQIAPIGGSPTNCTSLSTLNLGGNFQLTNLAIVSLEHTFTTLSTLELHGNRRVTDSAIYSLAQQYPHLTDLDLAACGVRQGAIEALATSCQTLTSLNLSHCTFVTDMGVTALVQGCRLLSKLYLNSCYLITDEAVIAMARYGASLREIHLSCCAAITDTSLLALATRQEGRTAASSHLQIAVLNIRGCHIVSDRAILTLASSCVTLSTLIKPNGGKFNFDLLRLTSSPSLHTVASYNEKAMRR